MIFALRKIGTKGRSSLVKVGQSQQQLAGALLLGKFHQSFEIGFLHRRRESTTTSRFLIRLFVCSRGSRFTVPPLFMRQFRPKVRHRAPFEDCPLLKLHAKQSPYKLLFTVWNTPPIFSPPSNTRVHLRAIRRLRLQLLTSRNFICNFISLLVCFVVKFVEEISTSSKIQTLFLEFRCARVHRPKGSFSHQKRKRNEKERDTFDSECKS